MKRVLAYRYRWVVLLSLVLLLFAVEIQWMHFSPVGRLANDYFRPSWKYRFCAFVDLLPLIFMGGFVVFALPCSYFIFKAGIVKSMRLAAALCVAAGILKILRRHSPTALILAQILFSVAQAFILNLETATVAQWFPIRERGMAMGLLSSFQYVALGFVMFFSPYLMDKSIERLIFIYSLISAVAAVVSAILIREKPPTPSSLIEPPDLSYLKALLKAGSLNSLKGINVIFSVIWGVLMALLVRVDLLAGQVRVKSTMWFAFTVLLSGVFGACVLPWLSDHFRKRKFFYCLCVGGAFPGIMILWFGRNPASPYVGAAIVGFFGFSSIPIGLQYGAELGRGIAEEIVQTWMTFCSQAVGAIILLLTMNTSAAMKLQTMLVFYTLLLCACFIASVFLPESPVIVTEEERLGEEIHKEIVQDE